MNEEVIYPVFLPIDTLIAFICERGSALPGRFTVFVINFQAEKLMHSHLKAYVWVSEY